MACFDSSDAYAGVVGLANVRKFLDRHGYAAKPLWLNEGDQWRLALHEARIKCADGEYDGLRGTLSVPQDRTRADSRWIELSVLVVRSLSSEPGTAVFICAGGPGLTNVAPEGHLRRADVEHRDAVLVGYRGVDGSPTLRHPLFDKILLTPDLLSEDSLRKMGCDASRAVRELAAEGIDVRAYNIQNVADDLDAAREALGYERIHLTVRAMAGRSSIRTACATRSMYTGRS